MNKYLLHKKFSQVLLIKKKVIDNIIDIIHPISEQEMVEIGPGLGNLTKFIVSKINKRITVIEIDRNFSDYLRFHPMLKNKINLIQSDVMKVDFTKLSKKLGKSIRIFGNLPYNISTPLILHLLNHINVIFDMHFMLQKELVERLIARPNCKNYGKISVITQYHCIVEKMMEISSKYFYPKPKVDSSIIRFIPHKILPFRVKNLKNLTFITNLAFQKRRKMIRNSLKMIFDMNKIRQFGIQETLRAENLNIEQYCLLANLIKNISIK